MFTRRLFASQPRLLQRTRRFWDINSSKSVQLSDDGKIDEIRSVVDSNPQVHLNLPFVGRTLLNHKLVSLSRAFMLPVGFPETVTPSYIHYVQYTFIQVTLNNINRILATQSMLLSVGVGVSGLPIAAAINWVLKDGIGQLGSVFVSALINKDFDADPKRYRFQAVALGQLSNLFGILSLSNPAAFLFLTSLGSTLSRIGTVAHLSSRVRIYENFSCNGNVADIMRSSQAQSTAAALVGTAVGIALSPWVLTSPPSIFGVFALVAIAAQYAAYRSSSVVCLKTFNLQRAELVFNQFSETGRILSPEEVASMESFVFPYQSLIRVNPAMTVELLAAVDELKRQKFHVLKTDRKINIWIEEGASPEDTIRAVFEACTVRQDWLTLKIALGAKGWQFSVAFIDDPFKRIRIL